MKNRTAKQNQQIPLLLTILLGIFLLTACTIRPTSPRKPTPTPKPTTRSLTYIQPTPVGKVMLSEKDGMTLHEVPAGAFMMGDDPDPSAETLIHEVYLDTFWIDETEITNSKYARCVADGICTPPIDKSAFDRPDYYENPEYADYPVIFVRWEFAKTYCQWAGRDLPSEAQWEKAARWRPASPDGTQPGEALIFPWGNDDPTDNPDVNFANYLLNKIDNASSETNKVGMYPNGISPYGALDMAGNVHEWVNDWWDPTYYSGSPASNPPGPNYGEVHGVRGGAWNSFESNALRSTMRMHAVILIPINSNHGETANISIGFRCAFTPQ